MAAQQHKKYFLTSIGFHVIVLLVLILGFDFSTPLPVVENTNQHDVISAVVLGDTAKSKIVTPPSSTPPPLVKNESQASPKAVPVKPQEDAIAIKMAEKKKLAQQKEL